MSKITVPGLQQMKADGQKIVVLTSYDFTTARLLDEVGVDVLLVGDSMGMVKLGYSSTLPVTVDDIVYHTRIVAKASRHALVVADMPYLSYEASAADAVRAAGRMLKAGAHAVKMEGGQEIARTIKTLVAAKIPVMGHLGLTPQAVNVFGGYKVQGRLASQIKKMMADARALQKAGAFAIVLECVPATLAKRISGMLKIPTIGIGAGVDCDGQVLVIDDLLGLTPDPMPRFVKRYANLRGTIKKAAKAYAEEVRQKKFPEPERWYR